MYGQVREHVLQIGIRIVFIEFGRLHQTHDHHRPPAGAQGPCEQPIVAAHGDRPDLLFDPVIVDGKPPIVQVARRWNLHIYIRPERPR